MASIALNLDSSARSSPRLRPDIETDVTDSVRTFLDPANFDDADAREVDAYRRSQMSRSSDEGHELFGDLLHKSNFIKTFLDLAGRIGAANGQRILELGAGQGWASALLKRDFPGAHIIASDLAPYALPFSSHYEQMLSASIDDKWAFDVRKMPFADGQFDRIFCFAAFHHFSRERGVFREAMAEILRVLHPEGKAIFLYEPSSPPWLYRRAWKRVNKRVAEDGVVEDLVVPTRLRREACALGGRLTIEYYPQPLFREGATQTIYYTILNRMRRLSKCVVSTVNLTLQHATRSLKHPGSRK